MTSGTLPTGTRATGMTTLLAVSALWLGAALAGAQPGEAVERLRNEPGWPGGAGMARALELTDEQKAAFREVLEQHRTKMQSLGEKMRQNHQALEAALEGDDPDPAAVGKIAIQGRALRKQAEAAPRADETSTARVPDAGTADEARRAGIDAWARTCASARAAPPLLVPADSRPPGPRIDAGFVANDADGTRAGDPPGGSAGIAGAVLFGAVSIVLIVVAPYPPDTARARGPQQRRHSSPRRPQPLREAGCDACDRTPASAAGSYAGVTAPPTGTGSSNARGQPR